ncbi:serine hydrolase domain-containing protein [Patulibacter defluvii]|uniref:serine hydrolase domain-containing protein n=1 Tax=Patulibacter defluvii TaxID=3095358 RepID=UPI002A749113|nr:serine hydrolase domain-containing protein [Patulibacter sp. DM4]
MAEFDPAPVDALLREAVAGGAHVGGVAIAADAEGVLYESPFGTLAADGPAVEASTPFRIASMTKALTSTGALQLVERGALDLDAPVASIVPAFGELRVLEGFDGDTPRLRPPASAATVRQLLNHTAGFGYSFLNEKLARYHELTGTPEALAFDPSLLTVPLVNDPGTVWEYGTSTDWVGRVIEEVSGQRLDAFLAESLFGPLGMTATTFVVDEATAARLPPLHSRMPDGTLQPNGLDVPRDPGLISGGGGAYSTAGDYARFMRALLRGGELDGVRVLEPATAELLFTPSLDGIATPEAIRSANPLLSNDVAFLPLPQDWGLGLHLLLVDVPGMRRAGTGDWAGLTNCYYWIDRASGVCGAVLAQAFPFFDQGIVGTALGFEGAVYAQVGERAAA